MHPGEHRILIGSEPDAVSARAHGWQIRDALLILAPGPQTLFAFLLRWPLDGTVAETVLRHGTGALNIAACRVGYEPHPRHLKGGSYAVRNNQSAFFGQNLTSPTQPQPTGRFPTNLILVHGPGCVRKGDKQVRGTNNPSRKGLYGVLGKNGIYRKSSNCAKGAPRAAILHYADPDGTETTAAWDCSPTCPVPWLDKQSGPSKASGGPIQQSGSSWKCAYQSGTYERICDSGSASRFYPQFPSLAHALAWLSALVTAPPC